MLVWFAAWLGSSLIFCFADVREANREAKYRARGVRGEDLEQCILTLQDGGDWSDGRIARAQSASTKRWDMNRQ